MKTTTKFARHGWLRTIANSFMLAAIMVVLGLSQLIMNFNGGEVVTKELSKRNLNCSSFIKDSNDLYETIDTTKVLDVKANDLDIFYENGYEGNVYPLINYSAYCSSNDRPLYHSKFTSKTDVYKMSGSIGTLITTKEYLEKQYGSLEYVLLADKIRDDGIYVTDFFADACIHNLPNIFKSYKNIVGKITPYYHCVGYVNGIIKTNYQERYHDLLEKILDPQTTKEELKEIASSDEFMTFYDEIAQYLAVSFSFNPDFVESNITSMVKQVIGGTNCTMKYQGITHKFSGPHFSANRALGKYFKLNENEIAMNYNNYNNTFGTNYTTSTLNSFTPHEVKFCYYNACDSAMSQLKYEKTIKIVALTNDKTLCALNDEMFQDLFRIETFTMGYYFDNNEQIVNLINVAIANGFLPNSAIASSIALMSKSVNVFSDFFDLIFIVLCATLFIMMVQFEVKSVKDKMKDIGILKALGARDGDLMLIFSLQIIISGLLMIILYILGSFIFINLANHILVASINELATHSTMLDLTFLVVKWKYVLNNCLLSLIILIASFIVPMLCLKRIKPTNVIKAKE